MRNAHVSSTDEILVRTRRQVNSNNLSFDRSELKSHTHSIPLLSLKPRSGGLHFAQADPSSSGTAPG